MTLTVMYLATLYVTWAIGWELVVLLGFPMLLWTRRDGVPNLEHQRYLDWLVVTSVLWPVMVPVRLVQGLVALHRLAKKPRAEAIPRAVVKNPAYDGFMKALDLR